ncbi:MAG: PIG-L deacetylase family protein [Pseudomonadota bacterium]
MLPLPLCASPLRVLCLGAHADDIEIGCGGTLLHLLATRPDVHITWVVFSSAGVREQEARNGASFFLQGAVSHELILPMFPDGYFPHHGGEIKQSFEQLKQKTDPHLVFTHFRDDRHQDHRIISDLTWNTWRRHMILEYEIPKYDGDMGRPNCFVPLDADTCLRKARYILEAFVSERDKGWMSEDTFLALLRLRGIECAARYAEAFYCRKFVLGAGAGAA